MRSARDHVDLGGFEFECGESVPTLRVAYETYGEYTGDDAVLVCHPLTGSAHVAGDRADADTDGQAAAWWDDVVGPGKAIDTREYFVVCANVPGSCYGTTGPSSVDPETGEPYGTDFPPVTVADWTRAQRRLLDRLGVDSLRAVIGGSVGGMNALEWIKRYPERVDKVIPIATAARLDTQCLALDAIARRAITSDSNWNGGDYYGDDRPEDGLALARRIGHVMYLSKESMERKFGREPAGRGALGDAFAPSDSAGEFFPYRDVESYLDYQAETFVDRFDANSYLYLTRAMDDYDLGSGYDSDADALSGFDGDALVVSFTADWHFTVEQAEDLTRTFRAAGVDAAHRAIESDYGHDAFLVEPERVGPPIRAFLDDGSEGGADPRRTDPGRFAPTHTSLFTN